MSSLPGLFHWFPHVQMLTFSQAFIAGYSMNACKTSISTPPSFRWSNHHFNSHFCIDPRGISPCHQLGQAFMSSRLHRPEASYRLLCSPERETGVISNSCSVICIWVPCQSMLWCWGSHGSHYLLIPGFNLLIHSHFQRWKLKMLGSAGNQASCASL